MSARLPSNWAIFLGAIAAGVLAVVGAFGWIQHGRVPVHGLVEGLAISEQLRPSSMTWLAGHGYGTVIDMRPDGEAADEPGSAEMGAAARARHLRFSYIPVPHGDIPESAVQALEKALADDAGGSVLLYCRSGRRAARTWSLAEASRPGGLDAQQILAKVARAGQSADDLRGDIERRIRARPAEKTR